MLHLLKQVTLFSETANLVLCSGHAVKPGTVVKKPANLSFAEAASVPVAAQTAWQGIFTHGQLAKGQTILIHGGAGGVGAGSGFICEPVKRAA